MTTFRKLRIEHKHRARLEIFVEVTHLETSVDHSAIWADVTGEVKEDDLSDNEDEERGQKKGAKKRKRAEAQQDVAQAGGIATVAAKLKSVKRDELLRLSPDFPSRVSSLPIYELRFNHLPIHVAGRYIKLSREYSQTPWILKGTDHRIGIGSVEECITAILSPAVKADEVRFSSAGREDRDVRMLGRGRPFLVEFINPRRSRFGRQQYAEFQTAINALHPEAVKVRDLQYVPPHASTVIKTSQDTKLKNYQCVVWTADIISPEQISTALGGIKELVLQQYTPVRVLHRRALALRERKIHKLEFKYVDEHHILLDLVTQAGTYVKEFVHGDLGRTRPSIRELLQVSAADLLALDVVDVQVDFPNVLDASFNPAAGASSIMENLPPPGVRTEIVTDEDAE